MRKKEGPCQIQSERSAIGYAADPEITLCKKTRLLVVDDTTAHRDTVRDESLT